MSNGHFLGGSKSSGNHLSENPLGDSFAMFIGRAWHQMDQKGQYLALNDQSAYFGPNLAVFGRKSYFFGEGVKVWYSHISKPTLP